MKSKIFNLLDDVFGGIVENPVMAFLLSVTLFIVLSPFLLLGLIIDYARGLIK